MDIDELKIKTNEKEALAEMEKPRTIAEIAVILDISYNNTYQKLAVWEARGWIRKIKIGRSSKYHLNQDLLGLNPMEKEV